VLVAGLNRRRRVADSRAEQDPEGEGAPGAATETAWVQVASASCRWFVLCRRLRSEARGGQALEGFGRRGRVAERAVVGFGRLWCACGWLWVRSNDKRVSGAGDGVRLHGRSKALKGATP
jgi:hypothetical protein